MLRNTEPSGCRAEKHRTFWLLPVKPSSAHLHASSGKEFLSENQKKVKPNHLSLFSGKFYGTYHTPKPLIILLLA